MLSLQVSANMGFDIEVADCEKAFCQCRPQEERTFVRLSLPQTDLERERPRRAALVSHFFKFAFTMSLLDPCLWMQQKS